jgi:hypothetical protein
VEITPCPQKGEKIQSTTPTLALPEGMKKSLFHPHPAPPPSRGREFLFYFNMFTLFENPEGVTLTHELLAKGI